MSMTETPEVPPPKPSHKRPNRRRKRSAAKPAAEPKSTGEFAGLTLKDCPGACSAERCVIGGIGVCGHPAKGALQVHSADAVERFSRAKKLLGKQKMELGNAN